MPFKSLFYKALSGVNFFNNRTPVKLKGEKKKGDFFRISFGEYRLGYEKREDEIIIYRILHRKEIYRYFP